MDIIFKDISSTLEWHLEGWEWRWDQSLKGKEGRNGVCLLLLPHWPSSGATWVRQHLCMQLITIFINFDMEVYVGHFLIFRHI